MMLSLLVMSMLFPVLFLSLKFCLRLNSSEYEKIRGLTLVSFIAELVNF